MVEIEPIITDSQNKSNDNDDIEKNAGQSQPAVAPSNNDLNLVRSHMSHHELHAATSYEEPDDARYDHFSDNRKLIIVAILSYCSFLAPVSSTSILSAVPEVAAEYNSTGTIINISNAIYMLSMGLASSVWGPLSQVWGRRPVSSHSSLCNSVVRIPKKKADISFRSASSLSPCFLDLALAPL